VKSLPVTLQATLQQGRIKSFVTLPTGGRRRRSSGRRSCSGRSEKTGSSRNRSTQEFKNLQFFPHVKGTFTRTILLCVFALRERILTCAMERFFSLAICFQGAKSLHSSYLYCAIGRVNEP